MAAEWLQAALSFVIAAAAALVPCVMLRSRRPDPKWLLYTQMYRRLEDAR